MDWMRFLRGTPAGDYVYQEAPYEEQVRRAADLLDQADAVLIGAGAGLSAAAGLVYGGRRFTDNFSEFIGRYGPVAMRDMYAAGFYPFPTQEERWAYWSRHAYVNRIEPPALPLYLKVFEMMRKREHFVLTTNVDHCFQKAGFDKQRLFYTQGDYGLWQCSRPCHQKTYDNETIVKKMVAEQKDRKISSELIPCCPVCGAPMSMNLRADDTFVEDEGWHTAARRYEDFLHRHEGQHILFLELGVGGNTPVIIKYPFWRMTYQNAKATYACINLMEAYCPKEIQKQAICIGGDIENILHQLFPHRK